MAQDVLQVLAKLSLPQWLFLAQLPKFGFVQLEQLLARLGEQFLDLFELPVAELKSLGFDSDQAAQFQHYQVTPRVCLALKWQQQAEYHHIVTLADNAYPPLLKQIARPPFLLFCKGELKSLLSQQMAIVGSRAPTATGKQLTTQFAGELSACGWTITSGLALGVDGLAHQAALANKACSVAVLGCGLDMVYPRRHLKLADELIAHQGCLLSEFFPEEQPLAQNFPRRNRIISGLSLGCLVIEAAIKSGSLISARFAVEQGREVFAVPGSLYNTLSGGCHFLIKQGAKLVETVDDINEEFQNLSFWQEQPGQKNIEKSQLNSLATDKLLDSVGFEVTSIDVVSERSGLPVEVVLAQLLEYELRGLVTTTSGGYIKLGGKSHV